MLSEKGFSLLEVLVSLTILSISVMAVSHFFHQANQISAANNSKLVATNLARMTLERVKYDYSSFEISKTPDVYDSSNCTTTQCQRFLQPMINDVVYDIKIEVKAQSGEETAIQLFPITVSVAFDENKNTKVEGYMTDAKKTTE